MKAVRFLILIPVLLLLLNTAPVQAQCAMCKATVETNNAAAEKTVGKGLNKGILYLMTIPYLVLGGFGYMVYRSRKGRG